MPSWKERHTLVKVNHSERSSTVYRRPMHMIYEMKCGWGRLAKLIKDMNDMGLKPGIEYQAEKEELTVVIPNTEEGLKNKDILTSLLNGEI